MKKNSASELLPLWDDLLRDYQKRAVILTREGFRQGAKALLLVLPTGTGKTRTAVCLPREGARVMVVCGQDDLVKQWRDSIRHLRRRAAAIEQTKDNWAEDSDEWIVATLQTLTSNSGGTAQRYKRLIGNVDLIIWDETDFYWSTAYRSMMQEFIAGGARVLGITATPFRSRKKDSLFGFYESCPFSMELREAFDQGWLVKPKIKVHRVKSINLDSRKLGSKQAADFDPRELEKILLREAPLHDIASLIAQNHDPLRDHAMVRCVRKTQAQALRDVLQDRHGIKCACVWGTQPREERDEEMRRFRSGEATVITNVRVLGRGVDIPFINSVFNAAPTKSRSTYLQMLGRSTRTVDDCLVGCNTVEERLAAIAASSKPTWTMHDLTATSQYHSPITAIDVLVRDTALIDRIKENHDGDEEEIDLEELDEEEKAEIKRLKELERAEREAERERRRGVVVGVTFESSDRDLFDNPNAKSPKVQTHRFMFGKWKGFPLWDDKVPLSYLEWYMGAQSKPMWVPIIAREIERRKAKQGNTGKEPVTPW